jgi:bifunctional non-homologous end joining protein LigD
VRAKGGHFWTPIGGQDCVPIDSDCFFQKHASKGSPQEIPQFEAKGADWLYLDRLKSLLAAVQMGTVEFHIGGVRRDRLDRPDRLVFDLDPDETVGFAAVRTAALDLRDLLGDLGLESAAMVTGGKGVHVVVALNRRTDGTTVRDFAHTVAQSMASREPSRFTASMSKARRRGRIFIDWQRNTTGATAICPWSVRAKPGAPVAVPLAWDALGRLHSAAAFGPDAARERAEEADPLCATARGTLGAQVIARLERMIGSL